jgi:hypothetical protein
MNGARAAAHGKEVGIFHGDGRPPSSGLLAPITMLALSKNLIHLNADQLGKRK